MGGAIEEDALLDYIEFQIFPEENRYEAIISSQDEIETVRSGLLEKLLVHSPEIKALQTRGANVKFRLNQPENLSTAKWFTKFTLTRFLQIIGSADSLDVAKAVETEISQLEEARKFHLSLYAKESHNNSVTGETDSCPSDVALSLKTDVGATPSDASKNELLRAMDLRLTALRGELAAAFEGAAGTSCSFQEINDIEIFSHHFGATDLRKFLCKLVQLSQGNHILDSKNQKQSFSRGHRMNDLFCTGTGENMQISKPLHPDTPVKYGASPAKAAELERESSSENEESSHSSGDKQSVERSRSLARSASPRRSASPMRRIQIGRSGSRRSTALTIKSLNHFPARERFVSQRETTANSSDEEGLEQTSKRSETNVTRMSVQDAISLFESKQRDQNVDVQKAKSLLNTSIGANKSVLRRWSSGMGENSSKCAVESVSPTMDSAGTGIENSLDENVESDCTSECHPTKPADAELKLESPERGASGPADVQEDSLPTQTEETDQQLSSSAEWGRKKEAELNELLMKMTETKPSKYRNAASSNKKDQSILKDQRGGRYDHYKEKRDERLRGEATKRRGDKEKEATKKRGEKGRQLKALQFVLDERKVGKASPKVNDAGRKQHSVNRPEKSPKSVRQSTNTKKEIKNPPVVKKAPARTSLPATRKSWPLAPSPRDTGSSPAKTPTSTTASSTKPTRRKVQEVPSAPRPSPKIERSEMLPKSVKATQNDARKNTKDSNEKKQKAMTKSGKTKPSSQAASGDPPSSAKISSYSRATKKSSVVPVETKPFLRNGSAKSTVNSAVKTKFSSITDETLKKSLEVVQAEQMVSDSSNLVNQQEEKDPEELNIHVDEEFEDQVKNLTTSESAEIPDQAIDSNDYNLRRMVEPEVKTDVDEELHISPSAWVEIEEHQDQSVSFNDSICQSESAAVVPVQISSPRVRHSLSQMLLEESSDADLMEWGNAENPPAMVYQRDAPKGLKRLLKFARKSKTDASSTGWSSPSVFSEGEDDAEESKAVVRKGTDSLLKKATFQAKNHQKTSLQEFHEKHSADHKLSAEANASRFSSQSLTQMLQDSHVSDSMATTKATRSFFSLSAFKGNKNNETKLR